METLEQILERLDSAKRARYDRQVRVMEDTALQMRNAYRTDTELGRVAEHLVLHTFREIFRFQNPARKYFNDGLLPIDTSVNAGADSYLYIERENTGIAEIIAPDATDIPRADFEQRHRVRGIETIGIGIFYSRQDVRRAAMQGLGGVVQEKTDAANQAHALRMNELMRTGSGQHGLEGFVNHPGIIIEPATTGDWTNPLTTAEQIVEDFTEAVNRMYTETEHIEVPNTAIFPIPQWRRITTTPVSTTGDTNRKILEDLQAAFPEITRWDWEPGLDVVSSSGGPAAMIYRNDPSKVRAIVPLMMEPMEPVVQGFGFKLNWESRYGGIMVPKPRSIVRLENI